MYDFQGANPPQGTSCNVERLLMSDWQTQVDKLVKEYEGITHERYAAGLAAFRAWYLQSYADEPDATLLTDDEVRDYRVFLTGVKGHKAATVNAYLAPIRAIVRAQGRTLKVKGVKQVQGPMETLAARDLGRLINAVDGPDWGEKRNMALINVMARAGLRVSEALALKVSDVELGPRSGKLLVREGKGLKSRTLALSSEARDTLKAYL
jgi:site-specific recombinase XerD